MVLKFGTSGYLGNVSLEATTNYSCLRRTLFQIERVFLISILTFLFVMVGKKSATLPPRHGVKVGWVRKCVKVGNK